MNQDRQDRKEWSARARTPALLVFLGVLCLSACALLNQSPIARIVADVLSGGSPLVVTFNGLDSVDSDGTIASYAWEFGDGESDTGATVQHVFVAAKDIERFTVTLTVTDDDGATAQTSQTIEVRTDIEAAVGGSGQPTARFTADPFIGFGPLRVEFDGSASTPGDGTILAYNWDFGDDQRETGAQQTYTFTPEQTTEFTVTLFVWNSQNQVDTAQHKVIVIVPVNDTGDDPPIAELTVSDPNQIYESQDRPSIPSLFEVAFDPRGSSADPGHEIEYFAWDFGDGNTEVETSDLEVTHIYALSGPSHTYVASLTVFDDQGEEDTVVVNITLTDEEN